MAKTWFLYGLTSSSLPAQSNLTVVYRVNVNKGDWPVRVSRRHFQGDVLLLRKPQIDYKPKQPRWGATKNISWFQIQ